MISFYRFSSPPPTHSPTIPRDTVKDATDVGVGGGTHGAALVLNPAAPGPRSRGFI